MGQKVAPTEQSPMPGSPDHQPLAESDSSDRVKMKKEIGIIEAVSIIVGVIVGAGIFVSPKGVLVYSRSTGEALIFWGLSGVLSLVGALCYAELGTMIPKSGGDYAYILDAFGPLPAFLYLWVALFIIVPTGNAITALTFAQYVLQPIWGTCMPPLAAIRLLAAVVTCFLTAVNCYNVKCATKLMDGFTLTKVFALIIIIISGIYWLAIGNTENFAAPFATTEKELSTLQIISRMALAMYSGIFSYSGWNYLNFVTEELKNPYKNLPRAICISMPLVTIIYVLTNVAYFAVLTPSEISSSNAVAVTFGDKMLGVVSWIMPLFVACSTFGALNGAIFASARLFFVGARNGHLPTSISLINIYNFTPMPSLIFLCLITLVLLAFDDIYKLINYVTFSESLFTTTSVFGLLWLRYKKPNLTRPIKVPLVVPIFFLTICIFLCVLPCYESPTEVGIASALILTGVPVYFICIAWKNKPKWLVQGSHAINMFCSKLFLCVEEDKRD